MNNLDKLFRKRIQYSNPDPVTFQDLDIILEKMANHIPFENVCIMEGRSRILTKDHLLNKMLIMNEGGLCYDLNSLLYLFLIENQYDASLIQGVVYDHAAGKFGNIGRTHVAVLVRHEGQLYILDGGFGGNVPLKPVPLSGETVSSSNGEFRIREGKTHHGEYRLEMKLKYKDRDWRIGYAFDIDETIRDVSCLDNVRLTVEKHPDSPFNKHPLLTMRTEDGSVTLTDTSFTQWKSGNVEKKEIDHEKYKELLEYWFSQPFKKDPE
ncbi:arylamine N-acetyltransferase [Bacillus sp. NTK074B]|nr:arylamine N-acetyltransferase [Bacillus sp. NTK074B]